MRKRNELSNTETSYDNKVDILADFWATYKNDPHFSDFVEYNDLGLPLAYAVANDIVSNTDLAQGFIEETFEMLIDVLEIQDTGFESLSDVLIAAQTAGTQ